ncbi:MAG TPA: CDP-diacylglycerol--glycerol-3-phosphate 3-phosphatidyltransferase [Oligoflexia bacterium]|nr:CDP-diacylglycerol--glycerol-3-phosphate 3-phosphatidyltransferase [Oligoflexia bacterium]HMR24921.1 CDP-diacylglycerol--glycerol-3-phosphate 3-phosphatidyltransferase [Oligoflexia bacterium]
MPQQHYNPSKVHRTIFNLPNCLSMGRLLLIPLLYFIFSCYESAEAIKFYSCLIFSLAMFTDFLDGYIARKTGQITFFGKVLDPMADKLMVTSALLLLMGQNMVAVWLVIILIGRELVINALRSIAMEQGMHISSSGLGKSKTMVQSFAIAFLLLGELTLLKKYNISASDLGLGLLYIATALSILSAGEYFYLFAKNIKNTAA